MVETLRKALALIGPDRRRRFGLVALLALLVSGLEAISALLVLALMKFVLEPGVIPELPLIGDPRGVLPVESYQSLVLAFSAVFGAFFLLRGGVFLFQQYALSRVTENTGVLLADRLVDGYLSMPYEFHLTRNSAELIRNAYDNVQQLVRGVFMPMAQLFAEAVLVIVMLGVLLVASPVATVTVALLMALTVGLTFMSVQPRLKRLGEQRHQGARSSLQHLQQGLGGLRDIKILHREHSFTQSFVRARRQMAQAQYWRAALRYVPRVSIETVFLLFVLGALAIATLQESTESILSTLGLFAYAGLRVQPSLQKIANGLNDLRYSEAPVNELSRDLGMLDAHLEERDRTDEDLTPLPFEESVRFDDVSFRYAGADEDALRDIDLEIRRGESIGIAGATGGGKTTLVDLFCGLLLPTEGRITVDGVDLSVHNRAWQRNIGVVHQSSFLTDDTLRRNVAFGSDEEDVDDEGVLQALERAELGGLVDTLPDGLDTMVGERGVRLSGGQRQRVTLARALYRRPSVLVLDEGTAALDNNTEARVMENLQELRGEVTILMVAHRLSTIRRCDRILFLDEGRLAGCGTYEELKATNASFRAMAT